MTCKTEVQWLKDPPFLTPLPREEKT
uniref:Uncharacterized protein n=1 Tax=Rhizophora mucronata TaxID=61149 RepID=A0A2P2NBI9_RHIMU